MTLSITLPILFLIAIVLILLYIWHRKFNPKRRKPRPNTSHANKISMNPILRNSDLVLAPEDQNDYNYIDISFNEKRLTEQIANGEHVVVAKPKLEDIPVEGSVDDYYVYDS